MEPMCRRELFISMQAYLSIPKKKKKKTPQKNPHKKTHTLIRFDSLGYESEGCAFNYIIIISVLTPRRMAIALPFVGCWSPFARSWPFIHHVIVCLPLFRSVQFEIYALGKPHMCYTRSLRNFPRVAKWVLCGPLRVLCGPVMSFVVPCGPLRAFVVF